MNDSIRMIDPKKLKSIYKIMKKDFPSGEYPPYRVLRRQIKEGVQRGYLFLVDKKTAAYAICAAHPRGGCVLVSYLAVMDGMRERGIGSAFLREIKSIYRGENLFVEVERPQDARTQEENASRERRIKFYRKAGFEMARDIRYSIWNIPMHLMIFAPDRLKNSEICRVLYEIYLPLLGRRLMRMMEISCP